MKEKLFKKVLKKRLLTALVVGSLGCAFLPMQKVSAGTTRNMEFAEGVGHQSVSVAMWVATGDLITANHSAAGEDGSACKNKWKSYAMPWPGLFYDDQNGHIYCCEKSGHTALWVYEDVHTHEFTYDAAGDTLTAICGDETDCDLSENKVSLTITANDAKYTASAYTKASLGNTTDWTSAGLELPTIKYVGIDNTDYPESTTAPTSAGTYKATITVGNVTASDEFVIEPVDRILNGLKTIYDDNWKYDNAGRIVCGCGRVWWLTNPQDEFLYLWDIDNGVLIGPGGEDQLKPGRYCCGDYEDDVNVTPGVVPNGSCMITLVHEHDWKYSTTDNKLEVYCANEYCPSETDENNKVSLTLVASDVDYSGSAYTEATLEGAADWTDAGFELPTIMYVGTDETTYDKSDIAPSDIGTYTAMITVEGETVSVNFEIKAVEEATEEETEEVTTEEETEEVTTEEETEEVTTEEETEEVVTEEETEEVVTEEETEEVTEGTTEATVETPATKDSTPLMLYAMVMVVASAGIVVLKKKYDVR